MTAYPLHPDYWNHAGHAEHDPNLDQNFKPFHPMNTLAPTLEQIANRAPANKMTGGETPRREATLAIRKLITQEPDVVQVLALDPIRGGRWLYLVQTPFASSPKFVVGTTDENNEQPIILAKAGTEWALQDTYREVLSKMS